MSSPAASPKGVATHGPVAHLIDIERLAAFDLMGVEMRYLTGPGTQDNLLCIIHGTIPPGVVVPLHAHEDPETLLQLSGEMEGLSVSDEGFGWIRVRPGEVFHIPGRARHALRNLSQTPSVALLTTTPKMGRFFKEIGVPIGADTKPSGPPSEETIRHFLETAARYGYWNATREENAIVGISM